MNRYSLLDQIASSLSSQPENLSTEALLYLLRKYDKAREAFTALISNIGISVPDGLTFTSQVRMQHGNIPDLVGQTDAGENLLLMEMKFWASLTKNQPVGYLKQLPANGQGAVVFIAPERRQEELWQSLVNRCRTSEMVLTEEIADTDGWRTVSVSGLGRLAIVSWTLLLDCMSHRLEEAGDAQGVYEVWQLKGLCRRLEEPFRLSGTSPGSEERKEQLRSLADNVSHRLAEAGVFATKGYRATPGPNYYRRFGDLAGLMNWSIGFDEDLAEQFNESLLWIRGPKNDKWSKTQPNVVEEMELRFYQSTDERPLFPLDVPEGEAPEAVVQSLFDQAMRVVKLLQEREKHTATE